MNETITKTKKAGKKKLRGWLIALIAVVVIFAAGAICCNTIGGSAAAPQATVGTTK